MTFLADLRLALRALGKARGFSSAAILTLALGMSLCVIAMAVMKAYLFQQLPYPAAERLYSVRYALPGQEQPREMQRLDWPSLGEVIEQPIAWDLDMFYLLGGDHAEATPGAWVTPGFVEGLGIRPAFGAGFDRDAAAGANEALISHRLWLSRFGGDRGVLGQTFTAYVSDRPEEAERFTIVGVLPQDFWHINPYTDILAPLRAPTYPYMVRLQPGVTPEAAADRITRFVSAGAVSVPKNWRAELVSSHAGYVQSVRPMLRPVMVAAALVLLVACANVAGLLLVRTAGRQKEMAVRRALGATHGAVARLLLAEAAVIGTSATLLAVWVTHLVLTWLAPLIQQQLGRAAPSGAAAFALDPRVLALAAAAGFATTLLCTAVPLMQRVRIRGAQGEQSLLHGTSRAVTEGRRGQRLRSGLIVLEIAVSLTLLAGGALMLRSVAGLLRTDLGFNAERVITAGITLRQGRYPDAASRAAVFARMTERLGALPGVESVGLTSAWPVQQPRVQSLESSASPSPAKARGAVHGVSDAYFSTLRIGLVAGRSFEPRDRTGDEPVAVVSETLARQLWPDGAVIGRRVIVPQEREQGEPVPIARTVVGLARDVRQDPADRELADVYVPILQPAGRFAFVLVRTAGDPAASLPAFRAAFRDIDPEISVMRASPLQDRVDDLVVRPRFLASLLAAFAAVAALLALIGVYGIIAYAIRQREREIAVRMALGADAQRVIWLFVRQGAVLLGAGVIAGAAGALAAGRLIESQLFGVTPHDPKALAAATLTLVVAGIVAVWWPARRAAMTAPATSLRSD